MFVRMLKILALLAAPILADGAVRAQDRDAPARLYDALAIGDMIGIMREEGLAHGEDLRAEMFPGRAVPELARAIARIYDPGRMEARFRARFREELEGQELSPLLAFFTSARGRRIVGLEVSARRALLAPSVEAASREALARAREADAPRLALIRRFVDANDLVEANVEGALNSNYAFYVGLQVGAPSGARMSERQILANLWAQEPQIRAETEEWILSYLLMAYEPLGDAEIEAYIALSESAEGRALNRALFAAFDDVFAGISHDLGEAVGFHMAGEDI